MLRQRPWSADALGTAGGAVLGYVVITFIYYGWHRWRHEVPLLDLLFGTLRNPRHWDACCGFEADGELGLFPMLVGRDLHDERSRQP